MPLVSESDIFFAQVSIWCQKILNVILLLVRIELCRIAAFSGFILSRREVGCRALSDLD